MTDTKVRISGDTNDAERALKSLGNEVIGLTGKMGSLTGVAGTLGGVLSISTFAGFIKGSVDAADHLNDLSKTTRLTVEQLSGVSLAAKQSGSDLTGTASAISKLAENMGKDGDKFAKLGITAKDPIEAFKQLADVFNAIEDPQQQAAFGATALGKSWKETAPLLAEGSARIGDMIAKGTALAGPIKVAAEQADLFNDQIAEMEAQGSGLGIMLANVMLPNLTKTASAMNDLAREGHPVLALWRGLAGMGQIPLDFLIPPADLKKKLSSEGMIKDLQAEIGQLERNKESGNGWLMKKIFGTPEEIDQQIAMLNARIETIKLHAADVDKPAAKPAAGQPSAPKSIAAFIGDGGADEKATREQAKIDAEIAREQAKFDKLHEMAVLYTATDAERVTWKLAFDFDQMDKERETAIAHKAWNSDLETSYQQARIEREAMAVEEITKLSQKELADKQTKIDKLHEMAVLYTSTDAERIAWKLAFDFNQMDKEREAAIAHKTWTADRESSYQQERIEREAMAAAEIAKINDEALKKKQQSDALEIQFMRATFAFKKSMRISDLGNSLDLLSKATAGMALHSRKAFEINKAASIASIAVKAPKIITDAYDSGQSETGSWWGGVAYAAAATLAVYAQLSAAQSASFGGGGSVAPSSGGTAGMSASGAASQASTQPQSPAPSSASTVAQASREVNIYMRGDVQLFDARTIRDQLIPALNDAAGDGVTINVRTI